MPHFHRPCAHARLHRFRYSALLQPLLLSPPGILFPKIWPHTRIAAKSENLIAELSRGVATLKSIAAAAPFLGLAGTCYGILAVFSRGYAVSKGTFFASISLETSTALVATAAGLTVAIPAAISYNALRTRLKRFESDHSSTLLEAMPRSYGLAQTLPLAKRFSGLPAFALIGAPLLAILIPMFALMLRFPIPVGLPVRLLKVGVSDRDLTSIVISVIGTSSQPVVYVNSKETPWDELGNTLRSQLELRPHWIVYVEGGTEVPWAGVAKAIDVARGLHAEVVLLTDMSNISSDKQSVRCKSKQRMK